MRHSFFATARKTVNQSFKASQSALDRYSGKPAPRTRSEALTDPEIVAIKALLEKAKRGAAQDPERLEAINNKFSMFLVNLEIAVNCKDKKTIKALKAETRDYLTKNI